MNKKVFFAKVLPWVLLALFFVGLFLLRVKPENKQLDFIPDDAEAVLLVDSREVAAGLFDLALKNPHSFDEIIPKDINDEGVPEFENTGVNLLSKTALFFFNHKEGDFPVVGICGALSSFRAFEKYISKLPDYKQIKVLGEVVFATYSGQFVAYDGRGFVVLINMPGIVELREEKAIGVLEELADKRVNDKFLSAANEGFRNMVEANQQVSFWGAKSKYRPDKSSPLLGQAKEIFINMNFLRDKVEMTFEALLDSTDKVAISDVKSLRSDYSFFFLSGIISKEALSKLEGSTGFNIPDEFQKHLNGKFILAMNGFFINENLQVLLPHEEPQFANLPVLPKAELILSTDDMPAVWELLSDEELFEVKNKYHLLKGTNNPVYIKTEGSNVLITNNFNSLESAYLSKAEKLYQSIYMYFNFNIMLDELPNRPDMIILKSMLSDFKFEKFRIKCTDFKEGKLIGEGMLTFKNLETHSLIELVRIFRKFSAFATQSGAFQNN